MFRNEPAVRSWPAFNQSLRIVNERIRQRIAAYITHRKRLPFPLQDEINAAGKPADSARLHGAPQAHAVRQVGTFQCLQLSYGVVVRFAFAIPQPGEECHGDNNHADTYAKFRLLLQRTDPSTAYSFDSTTATNVVSGHKVQVLDSSEGQLRAALKVPW
jgi:hypothetical protein